MDRLASLLASSSLECMCVRCDLETLKGWLNDHPGGAAIVKVNPDHWVAVVRLGAKPVVYDNLISHEWPAELGQRYSGEAILVPGRTFDISRRAYIACTFVLNGMFCFWLSYRAWRKDWKGTWAGDVA